MCFLFVGGVIFMPLGDDGLCWYEGLCWFIFFFLRMCTITDVVLTVSNTISIILLQGDYISNKGLGPSSIFMIRNKFSFLHKIERPT